MSEIELQVPIASGDAEASPAWPRLDARQGAMLAEMGINCWWQETPAQEPAARPSPPAAAGRPPLPYEEWRSSRGCSTRQFTATSAMPLAADVFG